MTPVPSQFFVVWATDRPGALDNRYRVREEHRRRLRDPGMPGLTVVHAGPTFDATGLKMNGTMLIVQAPTLGMVQAFVEGDPYRQHGVYESVEVRPWHWGLGLPPALATAP